MGKLVIKPKGVVHISYNGNGSGGGGASTLGDPVMLNCEVDYNNDAFMYEVYERSKFTAERLMGFVQNSPMRGGVTFGEYYPGNFDEDWNGSVNNPAVPSGSVVIISPLVPEGASEFAWEELGVTSIDAGGGGDPTIF